MKLLLFDLDGTLITTGGAGIRALDLAFEALHGLPRAMEGVTAAGKTDLGIVREIFEKRMGRSPAREETLAVCESYLGFLAKEIEGGNGYQVTEGVRPLVESLAGRKDVLLALGTGNLERGARIKLGPSGLNRYFDFGGFGSDAEVRAEVLRAGVDRAERRAGRKFPPKDVFVIGDTILDVAAGKAINATTVAVACGHGKCADLRAAEPDIYMDSFLDPAPLLDGIKNLKIG